MSGSSAEAAAIHVRTTAAGTRTASGATTGNFVRANIDLDGGGTDMWIGLTVGHLHWALYKGGTAILLSNANAIDTGHGDDFVARFTETAAIPAYANWQKLTHATGSWEELWAIPAGTGWGSWSNGQGYLGARIPVGGTDYDYYWVQITPDGDGRGLTINGWGAVSDGSGNGSGAVARGAAGTPEPAASGLGLLALGAAGVMRRRRQKQAA